MVHALEFTSLSNAMKFPISMQNAKDARKYELYMTLKELLSMMTDIGDTLDT